MPHREAAWALLAERLDEAAWLCEEIRAGPGSQIAGELAPVGAALAELAANAGRAPARRQPAGRARRCCTAGRAGRTGAAVARAGELAAVVAAAPRDRPQVAELAGLFGTAHAAVQAAAAEASAQGRGRCEAAQRVLPRLVASVLRPLAGAVRAADAGASPPRRTARRRYRPPRCRARAGDLVWQAATSATALLAALGQAGPCPPELAEAAAGAPGAGLRPGGRARGRGQAGPAARAAGRALPATIQTASNGPYLVTNVPAAAQPPGRAAAGAARSWPCAAAAARRASRSATAAAPSNGFTDAKDPSRVPDRRDTYPGQQVTIFDNRGLCQHSGYCTDRLATVFRAGQEPFVAPSGGRMDEIIRAVRDCPSGALSFGVDAPRGRRRRRTGATRGSLPSRSPGTARTGSPAASR